MSFIWPQMLVSLLLAPLLAVLYVWFWRRRKRSMTDLGALGVVQNQRGAALGWRRHVPVVFFFLGLTLLLLGAARPQMNVNLPRISGTVMLAFDVSASMMAADLEPTRMDAAKAAAAAFVEEQPSTIDIGVTTFSNGGVVVQPPTNITGDVLAAINRLQAEGGTSLGQGIFTALNGLADEPLTIDESLLQNDEPIPPEAVDFGNISSAVILLLTDGENTGPPDPLALAQVAAQAGVRIYTIGIGSTQGAVIELEGFRVNTRLNEPLLQEIARLTNGAYFYAEDADALREIYKNIDLQLTIKGDAMEVTALLAGASFFMLLIGGAFSMYWLGRLP